MPRLREHQGCDELMPSGVIDADVEWLALPASQEIQNSPAAFLRQSPVPWIEPQLHLTVQNVCHLSPNELLHFFGIGEGTRGPRPTTGTLADPNERDLVIGDQVFLIALEEGRNAIGHLCYRHQATVHDIATDTVCFRFV